MSAPTGNFDKRYIGKRLGLVIGILVAVSSGFIPTNSQAVASSFYENPFIPSTQQYVTEKAQVTPPQKRLAVISEEIIQRVVPSVTPTPNVPPPVWGKSRQIDQHTWTIDVGADSHMGTPQEIAAALNVYRRQKGRGELSWDTKLAEYAQSRANFFAGGKALDSHAGFQDYIHNQDGFTKLGFFALGENSSIGYHVTGTHLIEWVYAGDVPHDENQLSTQWTHVGVGVNGDATNLIFGGKKQ